MMKKQMNQQNFLRVNFFFTSNYITHPGTLTIVHVIPYFPASVVPLPDGGSCSSERGRFFLIQRVLGSVKIVRELTTSFSK